MIKLGTDCSGIGAPEEALKSLGVPFRSVFACERDKYAVQTFTANHSPETTYPDITTRDNSSIEQLDLYIAGYPCQAFSNSGKKKGESDARGTIFYSGYQFIKQNRPRVFILENVPGMLNVKGVNILEKWLDLLALTVNGQHRMFGNPESLGYHCYWAILNTKHFGIPQNRERVFIVGLREATDTFRFPEGFPLEKRLRDVLEPEVDKKYYLSERAMKGIIAHRKHHSEAGNGFGASIKYENEISPTLSARYGKDGKECLIVSEATSKGYDIAEEGDSINISNPNSETRRGRVGKQIANTLETSCNQVVVEPVIVASRGRNPKDPSDRTTGAPTEQRLEVNSEGITNTLTSVQKDNLVVELVKVGQLNQKHESSGRIYSSTGLAGTIQTENRETANNGLYLVKDRIRRLTPRECARLQGFPDSFIFPVSETQAYKQCGNSMSVPVIKAIIKNALHNF